MTAADDGFTGTNFNRPNFQKMVEDIEAGYVTTVIVKDMSRLGRDYLQVGYYTDTFFPEHGVRFIAVNDGVDSAQGDNEFTPFRNVMNEWYARDISRKVRSSHKLRGNAGDPLSLPLYGYKKDPGNPKRWIVDDEAADVVRKIYQLCIEGNGIETTARILQESGILKPTEYWKAKGINKPGKKSKHENPCKWCKTTITKILTAREYIGDIVNFKTYSKSFKNKQRIDNPEENWVIFEGVHEAIIDRERWEMVQRIRAGIKRRQPKKEHRNMFAGILFCADCGSKLHYNVNHPSTHLSYFNCSNYRGNRGTCNETHYIRVDALTEVVLAELNKLVCYVQEYESEFTDLLIQKTRQDLAIGVRLREEELERLTLRDKELDELFERVYEDNVNGKLNDGRFMRVSQRYDQEQAEIKKRLETLREEIKDEQKRTLKAGRFMASVRRYMEMQELTPAILNELIERIEVYHTEGTGKNRVQRLSIHYSFVGVLDLPEADRTANEVVAETRQGVAVRYAVGMAV